MSYLDMPARRRGAPAAYTPEKETGRLIEANGFKVTTSKEYAEVLEICEVACKASKVIEISKGTELSEKDLISIINDGRRPAVFRGFAADWPCVKKWKDESYLQELASEEAEKLPHRKYRTFYTDDREKGRLHLTDGKSKARFLSMQDFLEIARKSGENTPERQVNKKSGLRRLDSDALAGQNAFSAYLLGIHESRRSGSSSSSKSTTNCTYCPVQHHPDDGNEIPSLSKDVPGQIDLVDWYAKFFGRAYDHQQFFLTKGYAYTDLHYDSYDNFYVAVAGIRRWTLAPPSMSRWLVEAAGGALKSGSQAIPHKSEWGEHPIAQLFPFAYVDLAPGDILYVPATYWHLVESVPGDNGFSCAFNYFFSKDADLVIGQVSEMFKVLEARVADKQAICRGKLAGFANYQPSQDIKKPALLTEAQWSVISKTLTVCDRVDLLKDFATLWDNKRAVFEMYSKEEKTAEVKDIDKAVTPRGLVSAAASDEPSSVRVTRSISAKKRE